MGSLGSFLSDLRFGLRAFRRQPGFFAVAVATLALGIGATVTVFSLVNAVLLRPLPYPDPDSLYLVGGTDNEHRTSLNPLSWANYEDLRGVQAFASIGASRDAIFNLTEGGGAERVEGSRVTSSLLRTLGIKPLLGRGFTSAEEVPDGPDVVMLTHEFWTTRFGGDPSLVGRTLGIDGKRFEVVGVLPPRMSYPRRDVQIWIPYQVRTPERKRGMMALRSVARLKQGAAAAAADAELEAAGRRLAKAYPDTNEGTSFRVQPLRDEIVGSVRRPLWILQAAAGLLLAIACANVANLLLVRGAGRGPELAVRSALGASRRRIVRQFLTEGLLIGLAAAGAGVGAAAAAVRLLQGLPGKVLPRAEELSIDVRVLAAALAVAVGTALVFGIAPALRASDRRIGDGLKTGHRGSPGARDRRTLATLVVAEVALAVLLTAGAGLLLRSFLLVKRVHPGFDSGSLWTASVGLAPLRYPDPDRQERYYRETRTRLAAVRGIESVAVVGRLPLMNLVSWATFMVKGQPVANGSEPHADIVVASPDFFQTMRIPILAGRDFTERDDVSAPHVAIVNRTLASRFWPKETAIGKRIQVGFDLQDYREIVGVAADVKLHNLEEVPEPAIYLSLAQNVFPGHLRAGTFVARFSGPAAAITADARAALAGYDSEQAITPFRPMTDVVSASLSPRRLNLGLTLLFAVLAAILAAVGIYGVMAHGVAQRRQEIGIRIALGAARRDVMGLILRDGGLLAAIGIAFGLAASIPAARLLSGLLFGVSSGDAGVLASVTAVVLASCGVAISVPARRAAEVNPLEALRS
jgi:putative ABC transport system permease protein